MFSCYTSEMFAPDSSQGLTNQVGQANCRCLPGGGGGEGGQRGRLIFFSIKPTPLVATLKMHHGTSQLGFPSQTIRGLLGWMKRSVVRIVQKAYFRTSRNPAHSKSVPYNNPSTLFRTESKSRLTRVDLWACSFSFALRL